MKRKIAMMAMSLMLLFSLVACSETDVVGTSSIDSFGKVLKAIKVDKFLKPFDIQ